MAAGECLVVGSVQVSRQRRRAIVAAVCPGRLESEVGWPVREATAQRDCVKESGWLDFEHGHRGRHWGMGSIIIINTLLLQACTTTILHRSVERLAWVKAKRRRKFPSYEMIDETSDAGLDLNFLRSICHTTDSVTRARDGLVMSRRDGR